MHALRLSSLLPRRRPSPATLARRPAPRRASAVRRCARLPAAGLRQPGPLVEPTSKSEKIDPKAAEAAAKAKAKWWRSPELRAEFAITDAQSTELDRIFHSFYASLKSGMADVDRYHKDVSKIMAEGSSSEVDVLHAIDKLEAAKASLARTRMLMLYRMYRVLSPEQRIKVEAVPGTEGRRGECAALTSCVARLRSPGAASLVLAAFVSVPVVPAVLGPAALSGRTRRRRRCPGARRPPAVAPPPAPST